MSGHAGIQDTLDRVKEHYFFKRMGPLITDYIRSCQHCQKRKMTQHHTKSGITAYRTPTEPFQVWQVDLYGPLPITQQGYSYILTAVDMFSKYLVTIPIANKDTVTVASALTKLFTQYGVCDTLISDRGTEITSKCMAEVCIQLHISQDFTPSFVHHCLGACERTHRTLAERLTPYVNERTNKWADILSCITFSMNQSVNNSMGYSPHEIVFGHRPKFPFIAPKPSDLGSVPTSMQNYVRKHSEQLKIIRTEMKNNVIKSQQNMLDRENKNVNNLDLSKGDYVFMLSETKGAGQKLQNKYLGPFVVNEIKSKHLVILRNLETGQLLKNPVHLNRLKMAYVREPEPKSYFLPTVVTTDQTVLNENDITVPEVVTKDNLAPQVPENNVPIRRSSRIRNQPNRLGIQINLSDVMSSEDLSDNGYHKIKRVLGQRHINNMQQFLVHIKGEQISAQPGFKPTTFNPWSDTLPLDQLSSKVDT